MSTKVFVLLVGCFLLLSIGCKQESSKRAQITSGPSNDGTVRYSPDGSQVAFISDRSGSQAIWKVTSDWRSGHAADSGAKLAGSG